MSKDKKDKKGKRVPDVGNNLDAEIIIAAYALSNPNVSTTYKRGKYKRKPSVNPYARGANNY